MTAFPKFPQDGHDFSANEVGDALAGLFQRDENGAPVAGFLGAPQVTAVPSSWNVQVAPFMHVIKVGSGGVALSGLSAAEQITLDSAAGIPGGQARIDVICWDTDDSELVVVKGTPAAVPVVPSMVGLETIADVRIQAGDSRVMDERIELAFWETRLASTQFAGVTGEVAARPVPAGGVVRVPVVYPAGMFDAPPPLFVSLRGGIRDVNVSTESETKDGFTLVLGSNAVVPRTFGAWWRAGL